MGNKSPLLNVIFQSLNKVTRNMLRDFGEIENLQVSPSSIARFVANTENKIERREFPMLSSLFFKNLSEGKMNSQLNQI